MVVWVVVVIVCVAIYFILKVKEENKEKENMNKWTEVMSRRIKEQLGDYTTKREILVAILYIHGLTGLACPKDETSWDNYIEQGVSFIKRGYKIETIEELKLHIDELRRVLTKNELGQPSTMLSLLLSRLEEPVTKDSFKSYKSSYGFHVVSIISDFMIEAETMSKYMELKNIKDIEKAKALCCANINEANVYMDIMDKVKYAYY